MVFGDEGAAGVDLDGCSVDSATDVGNGILSSGTGPFSSRTTPWGRCLTVPSKRHPSSPLVSSNSLSALWVEPLQCQHNFSYYVRHISLKNAATR